MAAPEDGRSDNRMDFRRNLTEQNQQIDRHSEIQERRPRFQFSPDELRTLQECNRESFYQRSLPVSAASAIAAHFAVRAGYLRGSPKYGSLWKVLVFGGLGYFVGKVSYRDKCAEKLMRLPGSKLGEALRRRKQGLPVDQNVLSFDQSYFGGGTQSSGADLAVPVVDVSSEADVGSGLWDIDEDKNIKYQGLDESQRPSLDSEFRGTNADEQKPRVYTTYEALRQQNRDEYDNRRLMKRESTGGGRRPVPPSQSDRSTPNTSTNIYGDAME
ncbi:hypothetical protein CHUAL_013891 [Chamberlinius hualienensis]